MEPIDEYTVQALPEFDGKKFQNVAKEGLDIDGDSGKDKMEELNKDFGVLTSWLKDSALKDLIEKATVSARLTTSPCALVASSYGWSGNMERIMKSQVCTVYYMYDNDIVLFVAVYANTMSTVIVYTVK